LLYSKTNNAVNKRKRFLFSGVVQGVGFRPFIFRLAAKYGLGGFVCNRPDGVLVEVEGPETAIKLFLADSKAHLPPMADLSGISEAEISGVGEKVFRIVESHLGGQGDVHIPPDIATCPDCKRELFDSVDRRYRYPFINCTNCGPRLTIIKDIPYDRRYTSMSSFPMCPECAAEYDNPADRRFHAEPNACPECGPLLQLLDKDGNPVATEDPLGKAIELIAAGNIFAVKGLGGFHLAVEAGNDSAVQRLRQRKFREEKPLAIMVKDLDQAKRIAQIGIEEEKLLQSPQRPIVLLQKRENDLISTFVAPGLGRLGIMLPYTPLHHLLLDGPFTALVMTSGNQVDEPICIGNSEAVERLRGIADYYLVHNRDILVRCDDSIAFAAAGKIRITRRSRGFAPKPILLDREYPDILALGPQLKGSLCILKGRYAFLSPHIGDLETPQARDFFHETITVMKRITESNPGVIACDLHPGYYPTKVAADLSDVQIIPVQHHHAHIVSCMAENRISGEVIGIALDGTGYGSDEQAWGGEFLVADEANFRRMGHLKYFVLPGGEKAVHEPWRIAVSLLRYAYGESWPEIARKLNLVSDEKRMALMENIIARRINSPLTSGIGRLFDGIAALLGLRSSVSFEGQAAMELEAIAKKSGDSFPFTIGQRDGMRVLNLDETIRAIAESAVKRMDREALAGSFHLTLTNAIAAMAEEIRKETGLGRVALGGGCFQNRLLLEGCLENLNRRGFEVFAHSDVPTNDGGIALGQAVVAAANVRKKE
jgi:hydrogenase maturation protein HypF